MYDLEIYFDGIDFHDDFIADRQSPVVPIVGNDMMIAYNGEFYRGEVHNICYNFKEDGKFNICVGVKES